MYYMYTRIKRVLWYLFEYGTYLLGAVLILYPGVLFFSSQPTKYTDSYIVVDFSKPSDQKRFFIYDKNNKLIYSTYVAHGVGSGKGRYATSFGNTVNSKKSSLGTYRIAEKYYGKYGASYKLDGLSSTNNNARKRVIVIHPAPYIGYGRIGTSWGCFALPVSEIKKAYTYIRPGMLLFAKD